MAATMAKCALLTPPLLDLNPKKPTKFNTSSLSSSSSVFLSSFNNLQPSRTKLRLTANRKGANSVRRKGLSCNCLFGLGVPELVVIAGVVALVFGPKKLPEVGRSIGKTVKSFQQAAKEFESELKKEGEPTSEPSGEKITATAVSEEKQDDKATGTKETSN